MPQLLPVWLASSLKMPVICPLRVARPSARSTDETFWWRVASTWATSWSLSIWVSQYVTKAVL